MCKDNNAQLLVQSLAEALETMAFISITPLEQAPAQLESALKASIRFTGPMSRSIELLASEDFGRYVQGNLLGESPGESSLCPSGQDAIKEIINVTCGLILRDKSDRASYTMAVPRIESFDTSGWAVHQWELLDADGFMLAVRMREEQ
ncbi:MAG: hypothetical protein IT448_03865 [Phycisphaerales bacterium]|nr:hypothetical protein [Phycisphaerales bacterium]